MSTLEKSHFAQSSHALALDVQCLGVSKQLLGLAQRRQVYVYEGCLVSETASPSQFAQATIIQSAIVFCTTHKAGLSQIALGSLNEVPICVIL